MDHKKDIVDNLLCVACLCVGRCVHEVKEEKLRKYYLDILNEIPLNNVQLLSPVICWECEAILRKVMSFREQVKDSYRILQTYTNENLHECLLSDVSRPPNLKIHVNEAVSISPSNSEVFIEVKTENNNETNLKDEVADHSKSDSENREEIQTVMCDVKQHRRRKKKPTKTRSLLRCTRKNAKDTGNKLEDSGDINTKAEREIDSDFQNSKGDSGIYVSNIVIGTDGKIHEVCNEKSYTENSKNKNKSKPPRLKEPNGTEIDLLSSDLSGDHLKLVEEVKLEQGNGSIDAIKFEVRDFDSENESQMKICKIRNNKKRIQRKNTDCKIKSRSQKLEERNGIEGSVQNECNKTGDHLTLVDEVKMEDDNKDIKYEGNLVQSDVDVDSLSESEILDMLEDEPRNNHSGGKCEKKVQKRATNITEGKIKTIELSYEEMLAERSGMARRESFLNAQYKCDSCLITFSSAASQKIHEAKKHLVSGDSHCTICNTIVNSVDAFTAHYQKHMKRYECMDCGKRSSNIKAMHQHLYTKHDLCVKKYECNICGKISNSMDTHRYHRDSHKSRLQCVQCEKTFSHRASLMNHRLSVHEHQNKFPCAVCGKTFRWKTSLKRHTEKHDTQDKAASKAFCAPCDIAFTSVSSLQRHLRVSLKHVTADQHKFICDHCNRHFADKTKLRDHIESKHLHRTFPCEICQKPSKNRVGLEQHMRTVHKGRPNNRICHHCGKGFPTKVQLESHIRSHTGERPFMCEYCPTTFSQQSNLYKHHRQVHLNIKSKKYYPMCKKRKADGNQTGDHQAFQVPLMQYLPEHGFNL